MPGAGDGRLVGANAARRSPSRPRGFRERASQGSCAVIIADGRTWRQMAARRQDFKTNLLFMTRAEETDGARD